MLLNKRLSIFYFVNQIKFDVIAIGAYAVLAATFDHYWLLKTVSIPLSVSTFIGTLLSLLLAFRTSQSYERWWEARTVWGAIVNDSRTLIRQVQQFLPANAEGAAYVRRFTEQQVTWCHALSQNLRKVPFSGIVADYVQQHGINTVNLPNHLLSRHTGLLAEATKAFDLDANRQVQVDATIARLCDSMGKCERIKNTVFPRSYSVLLHFIIYVLMTVLPFGLEDNSKFVEVALTFVIPVLFICIERTAILMQDPFENRPTDTPMTTLSRTIESNLVEMTTSVVNPPVPEQPESYYMM